MDISLYGSNFDLPSSELPLDVWSNGANVKFDDGYVKKGKGYIQVYDPPPVAPVDIVNVTDGTTSYWVIAGLNEQHVHNGTSWTDITNSTPLTTTIDRRWTTTYFNGLPIINNKDGNPEYWDLNVANNFAPIPGWVSGDKCDSLRSFDKFLIAINVTTGGAKSGNLVKWSDQAIVGSLPSTWVPAASNAAGDNEFTATDDKLVDGLQLKDSFIIYKEKTCYIMRYIGGRYIFKIDGLFDAFGALATDCIVAFEKQHAVLTQNDFIVHDGNTWRSAIDGVMKKYLFNNVDQDNIDTCHLVHNERDNEIWICYPESGQSLPNKKIAWNYREDKWYPPANIPSCYKMEVGAYAGTIDDTWDVDTEVWDSDTGTWDERSYSAASDNIIAAGYTDTKLYFFDDVYDANGTDYLSYVERLSMPIGERDKNKLIKDLYPDIEASNGTVFTIKVGFQMRPTDAISWVTKTFTVGTDEKIDIFRKGRFISLRLESSDGDGWKFKPTFTFNAKNAGRH